MPNPRPNTLTMMLEHLIKGEFEPELCETQPEGLVRLSPTPSEASPAAILSAQINTADWLDEGGLTAAQVESDAQRQLARDTFTQMVTNPVDAEVAAFLTDLRIPEQVRQVTGMLTAYDWEWVEKAKEIRTLVVTRLLHESHMATRAGDRIKALQALGKVTEVGLFTEKVEVKQAATSDEELDARIKERIAKLRGVQDALALPSPIQDVDPHDDPAA